jgi:hypothetical protein
MLINQEVKYKPRLAAAGLASLAALAGCGSAGSADRLRDDFRRGIADIRTTRGVELRGRLTATIARLRNDHGPGRALAVQGFAATRRGVQAQIDLETQDSGRLEGAVRDARRSDRYLNRGADLLRAAGRAIGVPVGGLNGR